MKLFLQLNFYSPFSFQAESIATSLIKYKSLIIFAISCFNIIIYTNAIKYKYRSNIVFDYHNYKMRYIFYENISVIVTVSQYINFHMFKASAYILYNENSN